MDNKISSPTAQDTTNSYGCQSGVIPEGKIKYHIKGFNKRDKKYKEAKMKPIPLMVDKITMEKICGLKILRPTITPTQS